MHKKWVQKKFNEETSSSQDKKAAGHGDGPERRAVDVAVDVDVVGRVTAVTARELLAQAGSKQGDRLAGLLEDLEAREFGGADVGEAARRADLEGVESLMRDLDRERVRDLDLERLDLRSFLLRSRERDRRRLCRDLRSRSRERLRERRRRPGLRLLDLERGILITWKGDKADI